jgi:hypothetical protein
MHSLRPEILEPVRRQRRITHPADDRPDRDLSRVRPVRRTARQPRARVTERPFAGPSCKHVNESWVSGRAWRAFHEQGRPGALPASARSRPGLEYGRTRRSGSKLRCRRERPPPNVCFRQLPTSSQCGYRQGWANSCLPRRKKDLGQGQTYSPDRDRLSIQP